MKFALFKNHIRPTGCNNGMRMMKFDLFKEKFIVPISSVVTIELASSFQQELA